MKRENWQRVKEIFNAALELSSNNRAEFLDEACAADKSLRREVETLLHSFEENFLEKPVAGRIADAAAAAGEEQNPIEAGEQINHYKILKKLGAGGQGAVYLAKDLRLNRRVAVKFLPPASAFDSPDRNKRFRREAQSAAALSHPHICAIHEIVEGGGRRDFIVMQYAEGETLAARLKKEPQIDAPIALSFAVQIADALAEAHARGVIHRDIKPANIVVSPNGQIKILDFGLAKIIGAETGSLSFETHSGMIMGTGAYMSPEQARGEKIDARTDIWSFGAVFYEMLTGTQAFARDTLADTLVAIVANDVSLGEIPAQFQAIVAKTLQKDRDRRYQSARDLFEELRRLQEELSFEKILHSRELSFEAAARQNKAQFNWRYAIALGSLFVVLASIAGWFYRQNRTAQWLRESVGKVAELAKSDKTFEAYDLAMQIQNYQPDEPETARLMPVIADHLTVASEPTGAKVFLRRFQPDGGGAGKFPEREFIGTTPIDNRQIARGQYLMYLEKDGFVPLVRSISGRLPVYTTDLIFQPPVEIKARLVEIDQTPPRMAFVPGGDEYKLVSYTRPTKMPVQLSDFFIDKYEVSNREFKEFITAGGYLKKEFWQDFFVKDGKQISFADAVKDFKDRTGLPAPRSWLNQNYAEGKDDFPVTDITWYEAAAYAKFRGKSLPSIFQWEKAARDGKFDEGFNSLPWGLSRDTDSMDFLANFRDEGAMPVESCEFGASPYGCLNMAGNVAEWIFNQRGENVLVSGGAWGEKPYLFGYYGDFPAAYSSNHIGFRLVKNLSESSNGAEPLPPLKIPEFQKSSEADFKTWLTHYEYDKTPLEAEIIERSETDAWTREKISFTGANREKAIAYLYLPKNVPRPLQIVHWIPAGDVLYGFSSVPNSVESFLAPIIKRGRAVFAVVVRGYNERPFPPDYQEPKGTSVGQRKETVEFVTDWRRGLDYLETRPEIDAARIAFLGLSSGGNQGILLTAVENRYRSTAFVATGMRPEWENWIAEANIIKFAPHNHAPKLMMTGRYDEACPLKTEAEPLFKILSEPKRLVIVESGHVPPPEIFAPTINAWLDETLGKIGND